jgi:hypothetical protein
MFAELDDSLAVEVLSKMDTEKVAKIMNLLEPKRSSALAEILAGVARAKAVANVASANPVTGRDDVRNPDQKGGENYDQQNHDNTFSSRKPSSVSSQRSSGAQGGGGNSQRSPR